RDELFVPETLLEVARPGEPIALEVFPEHWSVGAGFGRQLDSRVRFGFHEPESPDIEFKKLLRRSLPVLQGLGKVASRSGLERPAGAICSICAFRYLGRSRVVNRV